MPPEPTTVTHETMTVTGTSEYMGTEATWEYMDPGNTLRLVLTADPDGREPVVACAVEHKVVGNQRKLSREVLENEVRKAHYILLTRYGQQVVQMIREQRRTVT